MKKLIKFFSLIFLLFITTSSCLALNDSRFVRNQSLVEAIREKIKFSEKDLSSVDFQSSIFMVNSENNKATVAVPILNFDKSKIVSEAIISVTIKDATSKNDVLNVLLSSSNSGQWAFSSSFKFSKPKTVCRYSYITRLSDFLKHFVTFGDNSRVFYMLAPNGSIENLQVVFESGEKGTTPQRFIFQKSGELKPISLEQPPVKEVGFFKSLLSGIFCSCPEDHGYVKLSTGDSDHKKTE